LTWIDAESKEEIFLRDGGQFFPESRICFVASPEERDRRAGYLNIFMFFQQAEKNDIYETRREWNQKWL
jgi:hypothetical protein